MASQTQIRYYNTWHWAVNSKKKSLVMAMGLYALVNIQFYYIGCCFVWSGHSS